MFLKNQAALIGIQFWSDGALYEITKVSDIDYGFMPAEFRCRVEKVG
jgi:hypothetical protein